jgi:DNA-directed RNA polymerase specialized sigma24 family protein
MRYNSSTDTDLTDEELIRLVQDGNEAAFAQLAARHSFQIWQLVVLNSRQTRDAEEILQDIWIASGKTSAVYAKSAVSVHGSER